MAPATSMRAPFITTRFDKDVQVLSIGNTYEAGLDPSIDPARRPPVVMSDERHWSQKGAYWLTEHGFPLVAVCSVAPATPPELMPARHIVCPVRSSASICDDLLADAAAKSEILQLLRPDVPVFLSAYIVTSQLAAVADWIIASGRTLVGWRPAMIDLTRRYASKAETHEHLYARSPELLRLRPVCAVASSLDELRDAVRAVARESQSDRVVVKSAVSSGGEGVFFVDAKAITDARDVGDTLVARGYARHVAPPFVVEAQIPTLASPTVDVMIDANGALSLWGVSVQRLSDRRYYGGFYRPSRARLEGVRWYPGVLRAAELLGAAMAATGYVGFFNVDFVIDADARPFIVEINPRRSALLDAVGFAGFWSDDGFDRELSMAEYVEALVPATPAAAHALLATDGAARRAEGRVVTAMLDGSFSADRCLGLVAVAAEGSEQLLRAAIESLRGKDAKDRRDLMGVAELGPFEGTPSVAPEHTPSVAPERTPGVAHERS